MFTYQIILSRLGVPHNYEHLIVDIFVRNRISITVSRGMSHNCIVFNLKLP